MLFKEDIILTFRDNCWLAKVSSKEFRADSLEELDGIMKKHFTKSRDLSKGDRIRINYLFDNSCIPEWIRQYSNHYFNREVELNF
jgi:hypothetical protein